MTLPAMTPQGVLPPGRHLASLDDIRERFVDQAPQPWDRFAVYNALEIHLGLLADLLGHGTVWVGGGFATHILGSSHRPMVVSWCNDVHHLTQAVLTDGALERLTLRDIAVGHPIASVAPVLRPMGGLIDAYLASPRMTSFFEGVLSRVSDVPGTMGYLEVSL